MDAANLATTEIHCGADRLNAQSLASKLQRKTGVRVRRMFLPLLLHSGLTFRRVCRFMTVQSLRYAFEQCEPAVLATSLDFWEIVAAFPDTTEEEALELRRVRGHLNSPGWCSCVANRDAGLTVSNPELRFCSILLIGHLFYGPAHVL